MKVIIFGATGKVGQHLVKQALEKGYHVTAFARNPGKLDVINDKLHIVEGDVLDAVSVEKAVQGHDVVFCALGMPLMNNERLRSKGTENIVNAMQKVGVKRFVCLSAMGTGDSFALLPFHYKYIIVPLFMRRLFADHTLQEGHVKNSTLNWTIVRPASFVKDSKGASYRGGLTVKDKPFALKISQSHVANFMLKQIGCEKYMRQCPALSY